MEKPNGKLCQCCGVALSGLKRSNCGAAECKRYAHRRHLANYYASHIKVLVPKPNGRLCAVCTCPLVGVQLRICSNSECRRTHQAKRKRKENAKYRKKYRIQDLARKKIYRDTHRDSSNAYRREWQRCQKAKGHAADQLEVLAFFSKFATQQGE